MREQAVDLWDAVRTLDPETLSSVELAAVVAGAVVAVILVGWLFVRFRRWWRVRRERRRSWNRHADAQDREPPVSVGETYTVAIQEFSHHHSGERHAVAKIEGFVVFVRDVPRTISPTETIRVSILSFNRGRTSATATFVERT
ncbi:TRAM domain-containing protein [Halovivax gelatinilyticus]|uniref:TRAM domain-containing protein n=1 Tax=Halovivax gelatinilyticus TaxID=2961597 RepID=UPI0020CA8878|nr:RNA-binding protein [Halovivax gelatinilyticus]